jgi:hypothetical protein
MRVNDLTMDFTSRTSSLSSSLHSSYSPSPLHKHLTVEDLFFVDNDIAFILDRLFGLGYQVATDESDRFHPTAETRRILEKHNDSSHENAAVREWPAQLWHAAAGKGVLTWIGSVDHVGFGHDWPVVKARGVVSTTPRELVQFLLDSVQVQRYNKLSQGRNDVLVLQDEINTTAEESVYGFAGTAKIVRAFVKPKMLPKTIEMLSLLYAKPLEHAPDSYMIVSRSVWEDDSGASSIPKNNNNLLRSEMLLGVQLVRPCPDGCELTTITHVFSPGVPEIMAKRLAPSNATSTIREIQAIF